MLTQTNDVPHARTMLEAEAKGLETLQATKTVRVPTPLTVAGKEGVGACLVMEYVSMRGHTEEAEKEVREIAC